MGGQVSRYGNGCLSVWLWHVFVPSEKNATSLSVRAALSLGKHALGVGLFFTCCWVCAAILGNRIEKEWWGQVGLGRGLWQLNNSQ